MLCALCCAVGCVCCVLRVVLGMFRVVCCVMRVVCCVLCVACSTLGVVWCVAKTAKAKFAKLKLLNLLVRVMLG